jgi:hypothetical protein
MAQGFRGATEEEIAAVLLALGWNTVRLSNLPAAMQRGQDASDELVAKAKDAARKLIGKDVAALRRHLKAADPSLGHLRVAIFEAHGAMDPMALAELVRRVLVLSELSGRLAAAEQARVAQIT